MSRMFGSLLLAMVVVFAVTVVAIEKPTKEFQDIMKANAEIIDLSAGMTTSEIAGGVNVQPTSLLAHMRKRDYDGIAKDAATLMANFAKIEAFWTQKKVPGAINFSKAGMKASTDLEAAAKAKDDAAIVRAHNAVVESCDDCHRVHRVLVFGQEGVFVIDVEGPPSS